MRNKLRKQKYLLKLLYIHRLRNHIVLPMVTEEIFAGTYNLLKEL